MNKEKVESQMSQKREVVLLTGASGSMGFEAFRLLWEKRDRYDIVLLLRPSRKNKNRFRSFEKQSGVNPIPGCGTVEGDGLKIVWGDALQREDVVEACQGIDWCLHTMALISPGADREPEMAEKVNARATRYMVEAIEAQDPEHIRMVYIGSVAQYGDRLPPVHVGRTGDPMLPGVYDHYSYTKIMGELAVMESSIRHKVSLRQTFIMIPELFSLMDPIMFHQPINTLMENIT
ncbi:MAG: NAD-dependent epimerase/dehydratase family protein, partial [Bacteroidota bacterium]